MRNTQVPKDVAINTWLCTCNQNNKPFPIEKGREARYNGGLGPNGKPRCFACDKDDKINLVG